jgi:hypothetical protein
MNCAVSQLQSALFNSWTKSDKSTATDVFMHCNLHYFEFQLPSICKIWMHEVYTSKTKFYLSVYDKNCIGDSIFSHCWSLYANFCLQYYRDFYSFHIMLQSRFLTLSSSRSENNLFQLTLPSYCIEMLTFHFVWSSTVEAHYCIQMCSTLWH